MREHIPTLLQRIWNRATRVFMAITPDAAIRTFSEQEQGYLLRALTAFVRAPEGTDPQIAAIVERSRSRIRLKELDGEDPVPDHWFADAELYESDVGRIYEALYDWHIAARECLAQLTTLTADEMGGLRCILPVFIHPSARTEDLDIKEIRGVLLKELGQDGDFDVSEWSGLAMEYVGDVVAIIEDNEFSLRKTIPPADSLPGVRPVDLEPSDRGAKTVASTPPGSPEPSYDDTPSVEATEEGFVPDAPQSVVTIKTNALTGKDYEHFVIVEDD